MAQEISRALEAKKKGFYIGNRIILPFKCQILKLILKGEIYTEMVGNNDIKIHQDPLNTSIYLRYAGKLSNYVNSYQVIKMIVADLDADLCDPATHVKIICEVKDKHDLLIHAPEDDMLFIE